MKSPIYGNINQTTISKLISHIHDLCTNGNFKWQSQEAKNSIQIDYTFPIYDAF